MKKINLLFLCTGNSCRSQMAEGWVKKLKGDLINAASAGIETHGLNPNAVTVMAESGVDISNQTSQLLSEFDQRAFDYVITVCDHAHETCPWVPNICKIIHVGFEDPPRLAQKFKTKEEKLNCYRKVRDEIKAFVLTLPDSLNNGGGNGPE